MVGSLTFVVGTVEQWPAVILATFGKICGNSPSCSGGAMVRHSDEGTSNGSAAVAGALVGLGSAVAHIIIGWKQRRQVWA
ncbi:hypothetical protein NL676_004763 [Syzygium grande]|nr:hypothetical protein NL676_004763 [Syzygium grande]